MYYESFDAYKTKFDKYLLTINKELDELGVTLRIPVVVPKMIGAYNARSLMGVMVFNNNIIFLLRRSDFWLVFMQKPLPADMLFNVVNYYRGSRRDIFCNYSLLSTCENICNKYSDPYTLYSIPILLECYSKDSLDTVLNALRTQHGNDSKNLTDVIKDGLTVKNNIVQEFSRASHKMSTNYQIEW